MSLIIYYLLLSSKINSMSILKTNLSNLSLHYISVQYIQFPNYVVYDIFIKGFIEWIQSKIRVPSNSNFIRIEELERGTRYAATWQGSALRSEEVGTNWKLIETIFTLVHWVFWNIVVFRNIWNMDVKAVFFLFRYPSWKTRNVNWMLSSRGCLGPYCRTAD